MNAKTKSDSKHSGHALRDQFVTMVAKFFADSGWDVFYDPLAIAPSGSPVRADLKTRSAEGKELLFEFKIGNSADYLPISAYAQGAQLSRSGIPAILVTNMKVPDSLAGLFRTAGIPIIKTSAEFAQRALLESLRSAVAANPENYRR